MAPVTQVIGQRSLRAALRVAAGPVTLLGYDPAARPQAPGGKARTTKRLAADGKRLAGPAGHAVRPWRQR